MTAQRESTRQDADRERLKRLFTVFTGARGDGRSLVYEALSDAVVNDVALREVFDLVLEAPDAQRRPSLLFAGVNLLLARNLDAQLAAYYAIHGGNRGVDDRLVPAFAEFCHQHREELAQILRERSTQTNEIRRSLALHLGLGHVHRHWEGPLALVEVGASAGLNLIFDRYTVQLNGQRLPGADQDGGVVVSCGIRGASGDGLLSSPPRITRRLGIDQHPVDLSDPDARGWLEACIWPEQVDELATLRGATELAASSKVDVAVGDATTDVARILTTLPGTEPVVVFTASLLSYLDEQGRAAYVAQLDRVAAQRPVAWVFAEAPGLLATTSLAIPALSGPLARRNDRYLIGASLRCADGPDNARLLALADPYLRWLAPGRHETDDFAWA